VAVCYTVGMTADEVRAVRARLGLTQRELAARLGCDRVTVARWETQRRALTGPAARLLRLLAERPELLPLLRK